MTPEKQRIAIAEACGWTDVRRPIDDSYHTIGTETLEWLMGRVAGVKLGERVHKPLPDYLNDLNAMHEAEKTLTDRQWFHEIKDSQEGEICYWTCLWHITACDSKTNGSGRLRHSATAAQRAEAFLRTIGKWGDSQ
jgi:hypothetical protein